jgi:hypothetical protein
MPSSSSHLRVQLGESAVIQVSVSVLSTFYVADVSICQRKASHHHISNHLHYHSIQVVPMILCPNYAFSSPSFRHPTSTTQLSLTRPVCDPPYFVATLPLIALSKVTAWQHSTSLLRWKVTSPRNTSCSIAQPTRSSRVTPSSVSLRESNSRQADSDTCGP